MTMSEFLVIAGTVLSSVAAVYALLQVLLSRKAEIHLINKLMTEKGLVKSLVGIETRLGQMRGSLNEEDLVRLRREIERMAETLTHQDKERIKDALYQPSIEGRAKYLSKLGEESARNLGQQLQP
jgi:hypothetical protein